MHTHTATSTATEETTAMNALTRTYDIPDHEYVTETLTVPATEVRKGDQVRGREVHQIKTGPTWVNLRDANDSRILQVQREGSTVVVERRTATPESKAAARRAIENYELQRELQNRDKGLQAAIDKMTAETLIGRLSSFTLENLLQAQAEHKLLNQFAAMAEYAEDDDLVTVKEALTEQIEAKLLGRYTHRALSRSTSVTQNILDDVDLEVAAKFFDRRRWSY
jgi:hypothetical protein